MFQAAIIVEKTKLLNRNLSGTRNSLQQLKDRTAEFNFAEHRGPVETINLNDPAASLLNRRNHDLDTASSIGVRNLCLDGVTRTSRYSNKLHYCAILLCNTVEPKLGVIGGIDDGIVLD
jgi:hypothetical protein